MSYCSQCKKECYQWENICNECIHKMTMQSISNMELFTKRMFAKSGIDYEEFKNTLSGEII